MKFLSLSLKDESLGAAVRVLPYPATDQIAREITRWMEHDAHAAEQGIVPSTSIVFKRAEEEDTMNIDNVVFAFAGTMIILSLILAILHSPYWLLFTGFVGVNLLQSAFTGVCPLAMILKKFGVQPGHAFS